MNGEETVNNTNNPLEKRLEILEKEIKRLKSTLKKSNKDNSNKPKREKTKYQCYMGEVLPELKKEHPTLKQSELMKIAAQGWRERNNKSNDINE